MLLIRLFTLITGCESQSYFLSISNISL